MNQLLIIGGASSLLRLFMADSFTFLNRSFPKRQLTPI